MSYCYYCYYCIIAIGQLSMEDKKVMREHSYFEDNVHAQTYERYLDSIDKTPTATLNR